MKWNWQRDDWPNFSYQPEKLEALEKQFLQESGVVIGAYKHLGEGDKDVLKVDLLSTEALKTSEIEGEFLNRESLQSSIRRQFGLHADRRKVSPAEQGVAEMMVHLYRSFAEPLSHEMLFEWHEQLMNGRRDLKEIGHYRTHADPMQVVSGSLHEPKVHYEAPPSKQVKQEMNAFIRWFNATAPGSKRALPTLARSGIAHLYFESIHPFEDGNGRIGRAISEKALAQGIGEPSLTALAHQIEQGRKDYYTQLAAASRGNEVTDWLKYFAPLVLAAQRRTETHIQFLIDKARLFDRLQARLNERQEKVLLRMSREGPEGFDGGLSAEKYIAITKTSRATATRDLAELVELDALKKTGKLRHTRYWLNVRPT
ncbi:MAG: Fic family protein [Puniceicoccales bacterium]